MSLEELDISSNSVLKNELIKDVNLSSIRVWKFLKWGLENISFLNNANKLEVLYAQENKIKDLKPIENLFNLKILYLDKNNIVDISSLKNLVNLEEFTAEKNNIRDLSSR